MLQEATLESSDGAIKLNALTMLGSYHQWTMDVAVALRPGEAGAYAAVGLSDNSVQIFALPCNTSAVGPQQTSLPSSALQWSHMHVPHAEYTNITAKSTFLLSVKLVLQCRPSFLHGIRSCCHSEPDMLIVEGFDDVLITYALAYTLLIEGIRHACRGLLHVQCA